MAQVLEHRKLLKGGVNLGVLISEIQEVVMGDLVNQSDVEPRKRLVVAVWIARAVGVRDRK